MTDKLYDSYDESLQIMPEELPVLLSHFRAAGCCECTAQKGEVLGSQGDAARWLFLILSGQVKISLFDNDGQEKTLSVTHDKTLFLGESGFFSKYTYNASMIAKTDVTYIKITREELRTVISDYPQLAWIIMNSMGKKIYHLTCEVEEMAFFDTYTRLIEKLLNLASENGVANTKGEVTIQMRLTYEDLAGLLSASREVITRHMSKLQKNGLIRREKQQIVLTDMDALLEETRDGKVRD